MLLKPRNSCSEYELSSRSRRVSPKTRLRGSALAFSQSPVLRRTGNHQTICEAYPLGQSADFYKTIDNADLRVWCICRAIYQLPTIELVEWLEKERWDDRDGKPETNAALVIRKLEKLMEMEYQGY